MKPTTATLVAKRSDWYPTSMSGIFTPEEFEEMEKELYEEAAKRYPDHGRHRPQEYAYLDFTEGIDVAIDYLRAL